MSTPTSAESSAWPTDLICNKAPPPTSFVETALAADVDDDKLAFEDDAESEAVTLCIGVADEAGSVEGSCDRRRALAVVLVDAFAVLATVAEAGAGDEVPPA